MTEPDLGFIHRYLPARRPDLPTLLLLHGTGGDENDLLPLGAALLPGAALLAPRGKVLEHGMPRYFRRLAEGVFDLEDVRVRTHQLADFVTAAVQAYHLDPAAVLAVGYSNGANIAANLLLTYPGILCGAALFHAQLLLEPQEGPNLTGVPVLLSGGRQDPLIPAAGTEQLAARLRAAGAEVRLHWEQGGHQLAAGEVEAARRWLTERSTLGAA